MPEPIAPVSPARWGKDHWSTLLYVESVAVDNKGWIVNSKMRCAPRLHRHMAHGSPLGDIHDGSEYPTRLKGGVELENHDDWSCVEDMVVFGLIEPLPPSSYRNTPTKRRFSEQFGDLEVQVKLTEDGNRVIAKLREHLQTERNYSSFKPPTWGTWWQRELESVASE